MNRYFQSLSEFFQVIDSDIQDSSFNFRNIHIWHSTFESQGFLREIKFRSKMAHVERKSFSQVCSHLQSFSRLLDLRLTLNGRESRIRSYI